MGLMNPNYYLSVAIAYLSENFPQWKKDLACSVHRNVAAPLTYERGYIYVEKKRNIENTTMRDDNS